MPAGKPTDYHPSLSRYPLGQYLLFARQLFGGKQASFERRLHERRWIDLEQCGLSRGNQALRFLDLGSGSMRPQFMLLRSEGFNVTGVDLVNGHKPSLAQFVYGVARTILATWLGSPRLAFDRDTLINHRARRVGR